MVPGRLALVVGEANYVGALLQTAGADATLVAKSLGSTGFDVSEAYDLSAADLTANYQAFLAKVHAAAPGSSVVVYLAGLGANVGCDDHLLPVDARIGDVSDVAKVGLSLSRVMNDLAQTNSQVRLVLLDGARPVPASVSAAPLPRGLAPLTPPAATVFGISAEVHDIEAARKPSDVNGAYALAIADALQQPYVDMNTTMSQARALTHQNSANAQTPWHAAGSGLGPFTFPFSADAAAVQVASANLPSASAQIGALAADDAYNTAIWRNTIADYQAYLTAFSALAPAETVARVATLVKLLQQPDATCKAPTSTPLPLPVLSCAPGQNFVAGQGCVTPRPSCPSGQAWIPGRGCVSSQPICPPGEVFFPGQGCAPPMPLCPPAEVFFPGVGCALPPQTCPPGQTFLPVQGCVRPPPVCPAGQIFVPGQGCLTVIPMCPPGQIFALGQGCVIAPTCPPGLTFVPRKGCLPLSACPAGQIFSAGKGCVPFVHLCPTGQTFVAGQGCVTPTPVPTPTSACPAGQTFVPGKGCVTPTPVPTPTSACPAGQTFVPGKGCVTPTPIPTPISTCPAGQAFVPSKGCVTPTPISAPISTCPAGQTFVPGKGCAAPAPTPKPLSACPPGQTFAPGKGCV